MQPDPNPQGQEREVKTIGGAAIDGTPIAYIIVLASVVTVLAFVPFSIVLGSGKGIPLSQSIFPLLGWLLGPIAGALASGIGTLIGIFLAPYTAGVPAIAIWGAVIASFTAGAMADQDAGSSRKYRKYWYIGLTFLFGLELAAYAYLAHRNLIPVNTFIAGSFINWSALLLFALPTRSLFAKMISSPNMAIVAIGIFGGTWTICGLAHLSQVAFTYYLFNWPEPIWNTLIPIIPVENLMRGLSGAVIGTGVISGLRAIKLVKPKQAIY
ncbi:hypothetical protein H6F44_13140 [Pseudanabaena sp. FACHB-1277]|jgi:hypothetical protein|uniref:ECF transporter S component n=1 Tax=Pseudanabaena cinerea FACHB-1277 TaxID=2949581 RepID=A0A926Z6T7_9CYAN|nr:hypothetical protein [Pseudanabaena cinerea]MBD2151055.1 hypothetical protein [Pseudanabaena cinerea FACHB-1277]